MNDPHIANLLQVRELISLAVNRRSPRTNNKADRNVLWELAPEARLQASLPFLNRLDIEQDALFLIES
jgi:hypothetical protein